ncbi:TRAP transporter 4TM/12TM fusion protein [Evansella vedderi]|uniref:TRAP transporter 4TM/12TM fusion protein n=1 Tax=Evansella vedderi TaxID=38282 RepID=A0ABT9ZPY2_9BACI|nr:TRAP transporter permease [Evansella vedderi]MDQ0253303.1 TRAP transporter 4TM/12TM fusion protein [Evansella vedderi]
MFEKTANKIIFVIGLSLAAFHIYTAMNGLLTPMLQRGIHVMGVLLIAVLLYPYVIKGIKGTIINSGLFILVLVSSIYFLFQLSPDRIADRGFLGPTQLEIIFGIFLIVLLLEVTRKTVGWGIFWVAVGTLIYAFFGPYFPGALSHRGMDFYDVSSFIVWTTEGIFGLPIAVAATFIILFIIFGSLLNRLGAGDFFLKLALALTGRIRGGPAQTAIVGSSIMGSVSGSSVSNVVTTGNFTIPLMMKTGYSPRISGGVEAAASTGGQIMPPVMGAAAFVMANVMGVPYSTIVLAALIPAILFYVSLCSTVYLEARKSDLKPMEESQIPRLKSFIFKEIYFVIPLIALVVFLMGYQYSAMRSALFTIFVTVLLYIIVSLIKHFKIPVKEILGALVDGVKMIVPVTAACATAGIVIGVISYTGLGVLFTQLVIGLSGGHLILALFFTMIACIILGMGLPTTAAYIITAILGAPALVELGVPLIAAHFFIFYFAIMSFITPPVAISAYAASGISGANAMATGISAFKLGIAGFIVPYMFVYNPILLGQMDNIFLVIYAFVTALIGIFSLSVAVSGWLMSKVHLVERGLFLTSAICLIYSNIFTDVIGALLFALPLILNIRRYQTLNNEARLSQVEGTSAW